MGSLKHAEKKVIYEKHEKKQDTIANQFAQYKLRNSGNLPSGFSLTDESHPCNVLFSHVRIEIEIDVLFVTFSPAD